MPTTATAQYIKRTFADDEALLTGVLDDVLCAVEGPMALALHPRAVDPGPR